MSVHLNHFSCRLIMMSLTVALLTSSIIARQSKDRVIRIIPLPNEPLKITVIKVRGVQIEPGKEFQEEDDWLRGLTFSITSVSDKPICFIDVALYFPRAGNNGASSVRDALMFSCKPVNSDTSKPLKPGKSMDMVVTDNDYVAQEALLMRNGYPKTINSLEIGVYEVVFEGEEDTKWVKGQMMRRDPDHPGDWLPMKP